MATLDDLTADAGLAGGVGQQGGVEERDERGLERFGLAAGGQGADGGQHLRGRRGLLVTQGLA